ncbi:MAG: hypothetical protein V4438_00490 [Patescibacteria group bacterium]
MNQIIQRTPHRMQHQQTGNGIGTFDASVHRALEAEAEAALKSPDKTHSFTPPGWIADMCRSAAGNGLGEKLKETYGLTKVSVSGDQIKMVA